MPSELVESSTPTEAFTRDRDGERTILFHVSFWAKQSYITNSTNNALHQTHCMNIEAMRANEQQFVKSISISKINMYFSDTSTHSTAVDSYR